LPAADLRISERCCRGFTPDSGSLRREARLFFDESVKHRTHCSDKEVIFYYMLKNEHCFGGDDRTWTEIYEEFRDKEKIKPRESLVKLYNEKMTALED
jgi:hypothetical protein